MPEQTPRPAEGPDREALERVALDAAHRCGTKAGRPEIVRAVLDALLSPPAPGGCEDPGCPLVEDHVHAPPPMSFDLPGGLRPFTEAEEATEAASGPWDPPAPDGPPTPEQQRAVAEEINRIDPAPGDTDLRGDIRHAIDNYRDGAWPADAAVEIVAALAARDADRDALARVRAQADRWRPITPTYHAVVAGKHLDACIACLVVAELDEVLPR